MASTSGGFYHALAPVEFPARQMAQGQLMQATDALRLERLLNLGLGPAIPTARSCLGTSGQPSIWQSLGQ